MEMAVTVSNVATLGTVTAISLHVDIVPVYI